MGQRLNIEIKENGKVLANAYYHWSGFTSSSLELTELILTNINSVKYKDKTVKAIKLLETTGAGLTDIERSFGQKTIKDYSTYDFAECTGRNDGLISISEKGIEITQLWEDARVEINLDSETVKFDAIQRYTKEEYIKNYEDYGKGKYDELPIHPIKFENIPFDKFSEFNKMMRELIYKGIYNIRTYDSEDVIVFIEINWK